MLRHVLKIIAHNAHITRGCAHLRKTRQARIAPSANKQQRCIIGATARVS